MKFPSLRFFMNRTKQSLPDQALEGTDEHAGIAGIGEPPENNFRYAEGRNVSRLQFPTFGKDRIPVIVSPLAAEVQKSELPQKGTRDISLVEVTIQNSNNTLVPLMVRKVFKSLHEALTAKRAHALLKAHKFSVPDQFLVDTESGVALMTNLNGPESLTLSAYNKIDDADMPRIDEIKDFEQAVQHCFSESRRAGSLGLFLRGDVYAFTINRNNPVTDLRMSILDIEIVPTILCSHDSLMPIIGSIMGHVPDRVTSKHAEAYNEYEMQRGLTHFIGKFVGEPNKQKYLQILSEVQLMRILR